MADQTIPSIKNLRGNIGIGTASPSAQLDVGSVFKFNTTTDLLTITNDQNTGGINLSGGNSRIYFGGYRAIEGDQSGGTLYLGEGYGTISLMDDTIVTGNVGIGTTSPVSKLTVESSANALADVDEPENHHLLLRNPANDTTEGVGMGFLVSALTVDVGASILCKRVGPNAQSELQFWNKQNTTSDGVITQSMTIDEDGNVGINKTSPAQKLHIKGDALRIEESASTTGRHLDIVPAVSGQPHKYTSTSTGSGHQFENSSGTIAILDANGSAFYQDLTIASSNLKLSSAHYVQFGSANARIQGSNGSNYLKFYTAGVERLAITNTEATFSGDLVVTGGLTINGTTTTIDTTNLLVEDKNIVLGNVSSPSDTTADGGGITLKGASDYTINWTNSTNSWHFNQGITVGVDGTGHDVVFYGDTADRYMTWDQSADRLNLRDHVELTLGTHNDLKLFHDNVRGRIVYTGSNELQISAGSTVQIGFNDGTGAYGETAIKFVKDGAVSIRHDNSQKFTTDAGGITVTGKMTSDTITTALSLEMFASGGNNYISSASSGSHLLIRNTGGANVELLVNTSEKGVIAIPNGAVELYHDNAKKFYTSSTGATLNGNLVMGGGQVKFADGGHVMLGDNNDLRLYHSGSSYIDNITNDLIIRNTAASKDIIFYTNNGTSTIESLRIDGSGEDLNSRVNLHGGDSSLYPYITGFVAPQNPEGHHIKCPYFFNDLAYARLRGATVTVTVTGGSSPSTTNIDRMLDASTYFWSVSTSGVSEIVITMEDLPKNFTHTTHMGITFGNEGWRAKNVKLEAYYNSQWNTLKDVTDQKEEYVHIRHNTSSNAQTKLRWTLSNFQTTSMRIASIYCYNYNANGMSDLYVTRDGGNVYGNIAFQDSKYATFGGGVDLSIGHDGSNSYIMENGTGDLYLDSNNASIFLRDSNSGNVMLAAKGGSSEKVELYYGGALKLTTTAGGADVSGTFGTGHINLDGELNFTTNGSKYIDANTLADSNTFNIRHHNPSGNAFQTAFQSAANGGTTLYHSGNAKFATTTDGIQLYGNGYIDLPDNGRARFGGSQELAIYHNGANNGFIHNTTAYLVLESDNIILRNTASNEDYAKFLGNGACELYHNNSKKLETNSAGVTVTGKLSATEVAVTNIVTNKLVKFNGMLLDDSIISDDASTVTVGGALTVGVDDAGHDVIFYGATASRYLKWNQAEDRLNLRDNTKFSIGNSNDLQLEFNGTHGYIKNNVGGSLYIQTANTIQLENSSGQDMLTAASGGAVKLFHGGNSTAKLETTSTGIDVTGQISSDAFGPWYSTSTYVYDSTNGTRYFWNLLGTLPAASGKGSIEYEAKDDENYPHFVKGTIAFGSFTGGSYVSTSIQHDQQTADYFGVQVRIDTSRRIWIRIPNCDWSHFFRFRVHVNAGSFTTNTSWSTGTTRYDTHTTAVPPNSSSDILSGQNLRAVDNDVTGTVPTYDNFHNFGRLRARNRMQSGNGFASAPAYGFTSGINTGMYWDNYDTSPQKDQINFSVDGTRRLRINEAGTFVDGNSYVANGYQFRTFQEWQATTGGSGYGFKFRNTADAIDSMTISYAGNAVTAGSITSTEGYFNSSTLNLHGTSSVNYLSSQSASRDLQIRNTGANKDIVFKTKDSSGENETLRFRGSVNHIVASGDIEARFGTNSRTFNLYETYSDSSNYERTSFNHSGGYFNLSTQDLGTGTASGIKFKTDDLTALSIAAGGLVTVHSRNSSSSTNILSVGGSSNGYMSVRHVEGKNSSSNAYGPIYINHLSNNNVFLASGGGKVGIGQTSSPSAWLSVVKDNDNSGDQFLVADTEGASAAVRTYTHGGSPAGLILNHYYAVAGSSNEYMRYADFVANVGNGAGTTMRFITKNAANTYSTTVIDNEGNVGIGTTSPTQKLQISDDAPVLFLSSQVNSAAGSKIRFSEYHSGSFQGAFLHYDGDNNRFNIGVHHANDTDLANDANAITIRRDNSFVGIGTASPAQKLHIHDGHLRLNDTYKIEWGGSDARIDGSHSSDYLRFFTSNTERIRIVDGGNVGIGTTSPNYLLDVEKSGAGMRVYNTDNNGQTDLHLRTAGTTGSSRIFFGDTAVPDIGSIIYRHNGNSLAFETNGSERMRIIGGSDGFVGIGTTSPQQELDVDGVIKQKVYTVSNLPSASTSTIGARAFVSDSYYPFSSSYLGSQISGGGSNFSPVYSDGSYWYMG